MRKSFSPSVQKHRRERGGYEKKKKKKRKAIAKRFALHADTKLDEIRNYLSDEIKHNDLMSEEHKKMCMKLLCTFPFLLSEVAFQFLHLFH